MYKYIIWFSFLLAGVGIGALATDYKFRTDFEAVSGVNWYNFNAAAADCEEAFKEKCKIYGGFAPLSQFR